MGGVCERPCRCEIRVRVPFLPKSRRIEGVNMKEKISVMDDRCQGKCLGQYPDTIC